MSYFIPVRLSNIQLKYNSSCHNFIITTFSDNFSGNVADWVKSRLNVPIVYTMYMKQEPFILPHVQHIVTLANQFTFMARKMLMLAGNIYGPLFSKQNCLCSNVFSVVLYIFFPLVIAQ